MHKELNDWKKFGHLSGDFVKVASVLQQASYEIRRNKFSQHVLFAVSAEPLSIGALLVQPPEREVEWHYYASYAEELHQRGLIEDMAGFCKVYKDPDEFCCLLVVEPQGPFILSLPYPEGD